MWFYRQDKDERARILTHHYHRHQVGPFDEMAQKTSKLGGMAAFMVED